MRDALGACLSEGDAQISSWLALSAVDRSSARADIAPLRQAVSSTLAILVAADLVAREPSSRLPTSFVMPSSTCWRYGRHARGGRLPVDIELNLPGATELTPLARIAAEELQHAITHFAVAEINVAVDDKAGAESSPLADKRGGFFLPDAFTNPEHIRYALKTTAATVFCYLLYSQLNWPGIHTCFITVYMVSLGTTAETVEKMTLRIAGCLAGALLGTARRSCS